MLPLAQPLRVSSSTASTRATRIPPSLAAVGRGVDGRDRDQRSRSTPTQTGRGERGLCTVAAGPRILRDERSGKSTDEEEHASSTYATEHEYE